MWNKKKAKWNIEKILMFQREAFIGAVSLEVEHWNIKFPTLLKCNGIIQYYPYYKMLRIQCSSCSSCSTPYHQRANAGTSKKFSCSNDVPMFH